MNASDSRPRARGRTILLVLFCAGLFLGAAILLSLWTGPLPAAEPGAPATDSARTPQAPTKIERAKVEPLQPKPPPVALLPDTAPAPVGVTPISDADLNYIAARNLLIPVAGVTADQLRDTFSQARSEGRQHDAIDILALKGTPVLATTDGVVVKLFQSDKGGVTLYELDPSGRYVYYYAHLMRYAEGVAEGKPLRRGEVIAYVGDTGNAGAGNYHLHFAIAKITSPRQWSSGEAINPYLLLVRK